MTMTNHYFKALAVLVAALAASLLALATLAQKPAEAAFPGANGKIVFASNRVSIFLNPTGDPEIFTMNSDGTGLKQLTVNTATDSSPVFSADGTKIAFTSTRDGNLEVYTMKADGSDQTNLSNSAGADHEPAFSPDGTKIAFTKRSSVFFRSEVYTMKADGSNQKNRSKNSATDADPAWSPDGTKIAFETDREGGFDVYTMNPNGSNPTRLTNHSASEIDPAWSPNGTKIAFASNQFNEFTNPEAGYEIFTTNLDGTGHSQLTINNSSDSRYPAWSPDGTKIAFHSFRDGNWEVYTMEANGSNQTNRSNKSAKDFDPDWQPVVR